MLSETFNQTVGCRVFIIELQSFISSSVARSTFLLQTVHRGWNATIIWFHTGKCFKSGTYAETQFIHLRIAIGIMNQHFKTFGSTGLCAELFCFSIQHYCQTGLEASRIGGFKYSCFKSLKRKRYIIMKFLQSWFWLAVTCRTGLTFRSDPICDYWNRSNILDQLVADWTFPSKAVVHNAINIPIEYLCNRGWPDWE